MTSVSHAHDSAARTSRLLWRVAQKPWAAARGVTGFAGVSKANCAVVARLEARGRMHVLANGEGLLATAAGQMASMRELVGDDARSRKPVRRNAGQARLLQTAAEQALEPDRSGGCRGRCSCATLTPARRLRTTLGVHPAG